MYSARQQEAATQVFAVTAILLSSSFAVDDSTPGVDM
jgi:hypothetical protein